MIVKSIISFYIKLVFLWEIDVRKIIICVTLFLFSGPALSATYYDLDSYLTFFIIKELVENKQVSTLVETGQLEDRDLNYFVSKVIFSLKNMERDKPELWQLFKKAHEELNTSPRKVETMAAIGITITKNDNITNEQMMEYFVKEHFHFVVQDLERSLSTLVGLEELVNRQSRELSQEEPVRGLLERSIQKIKGTCRSVFGG